MFEAPKVWRSGLGRRHSSHLRLYRGRVLFRPALFDPALLGSGLGLHPPSSLRLYWGTGRVPSPIGALS